MNFLSEMTAITTTRKTIEILSLWYRLESCDFLTIRQGAQDTYYYYYHYNTYIFHMIDTYVDYLPRSI